jgi:riboflavin synthase
MFTGLVKDIGTIERIIANQAGQQLIIKSSKLLSQIKIDDSVAVNGCCLTATEIMNESFKVQAVHVTLEKTTTGKLAVGDKVNLELALRASDRLGGHFVQGHINGVGKMVKTNQRGDNFELSIEVPSELKKYMIQEGSIALDGISLTLSHVNESNIVVVSIIPHTWHSTILHTKRNGDMINIEVDVLAKYLENFMLNAQKNNHYNKALSEFLSV